jgi:hypothetical protein
VAKLIGETVKTRDGVGGSGDSLSGNARGQGGLADWAQMRARVLLSQRSDARRSDAHAAAVTRSHSRSQAQPADTDGCLHSPSTSPIPSPSTSPALTSSSGVLLVARTTRRDA